MIAGVEYSAAIVAGFVTRDRAVLDGESAPVKYATTPLSGVFRDGAVGDAQIAGGDVIAVKVVRAAGVEYTTKKTVVTFDVTVGDGDSAGLIGYPATRIFRNGAVSDGESAGIIVITINATVVIERVVMETEGPSLERTLRARTVS